jgi:hypothetical protein
MQSSALRTPRLGTKTLDKRRHHRVNVALLGRYMLSSRQEYPCRTVDMSPGGVSLITPIRGIIGERVVVYLEHIGRIEGQIVRHIADGFAMNISATPRKRDKLASQLTWLANRSALGLPEDRRHERITPRVSRTSMTIEDGREYIVRVIDISLSGCAVSSDIKPPMGSAITIGHTQGKIVRHFEAGIAIEFRTPLSTDVFDENIIL